MSRMQRTLSTRWRADLEAIARAHGTNLAALTQTPRTRRTHIAPRVECYRYLREQGWSTPQIGGLFNRDHSSVLYWLDEDLRARSNQRSAANVSRYQHVEQAR